MYRSWTPVGVDTTDEKKRLRVLASGGKEDVDITFSDNHKKPP